MDGSTAILTLQGIAKRFGDKEALKSVDLSVAPGEVHVVCGENGAGKSTLMNILAGIHQADAGTISLRGMPVSIPDPIAASRLGIGMVHQHFKLVPSMSVAENLYLGRNPRKYLVFSNRAEMERRAAELIARYRFDLDPRAPVGRLSVGQRQRVEILKALAFDAEILILDEPTAVLTPPEVGELLDVIANLRERGRTVLFITHKLREVKAVADHVSVLRHGESVGTHLAAEVSEADIARAMVGRQVFLSGRGADADKPRTFGPALLELENVSVSNASGRRLLDAVSLAVRAGEVVGIAGVDGNGQTELAEAIAGLLPIQAGTVRLNGRAITGTTVPERISAGLGFVPEDRLDRGLSPTMTIAENVAATNYRRAHLLRGGLVDPARRDAFAERAIREFDVRGAAPDRAIGQLSGGNMQKLVVAREMARRPRVLVVAQPTRGLDIGAAEFIHSRILEAADAGAAVLLISSELSEVLLLSDRIGVMYRGRMLAVLPRKQAEEERIGILMNGGEAQAA
ncbi:ABC transporter ATP-binding protein [Mesorhizobium sp. RP14(2022)]|uniref:ABC transporter ATP-binding protein n=1 Tax=Mesorhizobium liriopis TaxID=2953882 RepID=A0ABT1CBJ7_9HYPH|nr:ABC transporter ATP-binding protein [Mesorhizobium liriopis]MCO6052196.1 ABC transporter ATP-binding protein [Mesorhizobium liriopis]